MKITSSYGVELRKQNIPIRQTLDVYRSAVSYLVEIYAQVWEELEGILEAKKRFNEAEHLIHTTKKNQARFDFDIRFQKMPSYLRRAAIQHALGSVSSYKTRLGLWKKTSQIEGKPRLVYETGMRCEAYSLTKLDWDCGKKQVREKVNRNLYMRIMPCRSFTVM